MGARRWSGWCGAVVALTAAFPGFVQAQNPVAAQPRFLARGALSCGSANCHGRTRTTPFPTPTGKILGNELALWDEAKNHSRAYRILDEDRSKSIAKKLSIESAKTSDRCLSCHSTAYETSTANTFTRESVLQQGVGCESCHGPAEQWISKHYENGWPVGASPVKTQLGMIANDDLVARAQNCAGCHVGAPAGNGLPLRDVDHDLIAAGHPRLNFEISAFMDMLGVSREGAEPEKHWRTSRAHIPDGKPGFSARLWAIGVVANAKAALDLLADRVGRSQADGAPGAWPEFTEFDCFSCHHSLADQKWRALAIEKPAVPGRPKWGTWNYPMIQVLAAAEPGPENVKPATTLRELETLMAQPSPDPAEVIRLARAGSSELDAWLQNLESLAFDAGRVAGLLKSYEQLASKGVVKGWDDATQRYLMGTALNLAADSLGAQPDPQWRAEFQKIRDFLAYPEGYDSPRGFEPGKTARPAGAGKPAVPYVVTDRLTVPPAEN